MNKEVGMQHCTLHVPLFVLVYIYHFLLKQNLTAGTRSLAICIALVGRIQANHLSRPMQAATMHIPHYLSYTPRECSASQKDKVCGWAADHIFPLAEALVGLHLPVTCLYCLATVEKALRGTSLQATEGGTVREVSLHCNTEQGPARRGALWG